ncbi:hypothetical protein [Nocardia noduli]|uniref:hypothetical protein n=1 Tax=Nocardia noduli TaxID=2815722 RepID=UPI001C21AC0E|nr:hypothetical protein [Nocardia noduli]
MKRNNSTRRTDSGYQDNVIDLASRRRGQLERRGANPLEVAVALCLETGSFPAWDTDTDDGGWAA